MNPFRWHFSIFSIHSESTRFGALKSHSTHHFFGNACTKSGLLRFSQFSGCWLILSVYILMSSEFGNFVIILIRSGRFCHKYTVYTGRKWNYTTNKRTNNSCISKNNFISWKIEYGEIYTRNLFTCVTYCSSFLSYFLLSWTIWSNSSIHFCMAITFVSIGPPCI